MSVRLSLWNTRKSLQHFVIFQCLSMSIIHKCSLCSSTAGRLSFKPRVVERCCLETLLRYLLNCPCYLDLSAALSFECIVAAICGWLCLSSEHMSKATHIGQIRACPHTPLFLYCVFFSLFRPAHTWIKYIATSTSHVSITMSRKIIY